MAVHCQASDTLRALLKGLCDRNLTVYLSPPGRGAIVAHAFHTPEELATVRPGAVAVESAPPRIGGGSEAKWNEALAEIALLKERVAALEAKLP